MSQKIFISYTLKDKSLTKLKLYKFKKQLSTIFNISTYIDLIDNTNSINPQKEVVEQLLRSDVVWVINSTEIVQSEWVRKEIDIAKENQKTTHYISMDLVNMILSATNMELADLIQQYAQ